MYKKIVCLMVLISSFNTYASSEIDRRLEAQGQLLTDYQQKITDLQMEVDQLRGQLEQTTYQLNQTIERQKMILQRLEENSPNQNNNDNKTQSNNANVNTNNSEQQSLANWSSSGDDKKDYEFIMKFVMKHKKSKEAISALQQFLKDYPKSSYLANVNYWLGQLCYGQGRKDDASFYYATVVKNYPKSAKAGDSLYKVGLILLEKGDKVKSKAVFKQVVSLYPNNKNAVNLANGKLATLK